MKWKLEKIINSHIQNLDEYKEISENLSSYDMNILIHNIYLKIKTTKINMLYDEGFNYFYVFAPEYNNYLKCWFHRYKKSIIFEIWKYKHKPELGMVRIGVLRYLL